KTPLLVPVSSFAAPTTTKKILRKKLWVISKPSLLGSPLLVKVLRSKHRLSVPSKLCSSSSAPPRSPSPPSLSVQYTDVMSCVSCPCWRNTRSLLSCCVSTSRSIRKLRLMLMKWASSSSLPTSFTISLTPSLPTKRLVSNNFSLTSVLTSNQDMLAQRRREAADKAVFPCVLRPVQVFNKKDPIVVGVDVIEGSLRIGTPIAAVRSKPDGEKEVIVLGRVTSIRLQETNLQIVKKGHPSVAVKIEGPN